MMSDEGKTPLHPLEERVLSSLREVGQSSFDALVASSRLMPDQVRRAVSWLSTKGLVTVKEEMVTRIKQTGEPPELTLLDKLHARGGALEMNELRKSFASNQEFTAAVGRASSPGWIEITAGTSGPVALIKKPQGSEALRNLLKKLSASPALSSLSQVERSMVLDLTKRGILTRIEEKKVTVTITEDGRKTLSFQKKEQYLERLTPEVLASLRSSGGSVKLRPIDVSAPAAGFHPGRRHPVKDFINEVREVYLSMGFSEIIGDSIQSSFWNFDALFTPQDHPARELQDTFYIKGGVDRSLQRTGVVAQVALAHESGGDTGSKGWGYTWNVEEARRLVLRTHNTALTIRATMESRGRESRVFSVGRVFRNENLDYKHLAELHQMEGIVIGDGITLRDLMGVLTSFYGKLGMKGVKLWPTYFPYTEPSMQVMVFYEKVGKWLEMGGSGMFRPEVTAPLGVRKPVIAWGCGLERLLMLRLGIQDIRELYNSDLEWLRERSEIASSQDIL